MYSMFNTICKSIILNLKNLLTIVFLIVCELFYILFFHSYNMPFLIEYLISVTNK